MKIGLIDVDGHNFPNLCLMKLAAYHKSIGDDVEWYSSDTLMYDLVYMTKVFSDEYTKDIPTPGNTLKCIRGGTGYAISLENGKEVYGSRDMGALMATLILAIIPIVIFYLACQKYIIRGVMAGAVKG